MTLLIPFLLEPVLWLGFTVLALAVIKAALRIA